MADENISLKSLRDMWKAVSDWVQGKEDYKPSVDVDNFPEEQKVEIVNKQEDIKINNLSDVTDKLSSLESELKKVNEKLDDTRDFNLNEDKTQQFGNSSDDKPNNAEEGNIYMELDTKDVFIFSKEEWVKL